MADLLVALSVDYLAGRLADLLVEMMVEMMVTKMAVKMAAHWVETMAALLVDRWVAYLVAMSVVPSGHQMVVQ